ncbi:MAG TPA: bifunctional DedA family/phosphatase PAP2 family protein [Solirubrobacteraceae bacterium]|nr:bifunctional DedA family/phosphatase PAP2 family protein [Solirubrobacteraceae bacterium]
MKPLWLFLAAALAGLLAWRRRRLEPTLLAGGALAAVAMAVYGTGLVKLPNLEHLLVRLGETLGGWTYVLVGVMAFFETGAFVGLIAPGETVMLVGGLIAGQGQVEVLVLIALAWAAAVAGDVTSLYLGRRLGRQFLVRHGPKVSITEERLHHVERFFDRHGGKAILVGRFVGLVRAIAPFLAGSSGMTLRRFLPYDIIGAGLWASTFIILGYVFWQSFSTLLNYAKTGALALGTTITIVVLGVWAYRWLKVPEHRDALRAWLDRQAERPLVRPVARVLRPVVARLRAPALFVWNRVTPGELGLELTTLLAVVAVGSFAFGSNAITLSHQDYAVFDQRALSVATDLATPVLIDVARVVTVLGAFPSAVVLVLATAGLLTWRGEPRPAVALVLALAITFVLVHVIKDAYERPRPATALTGSEGWAFPSGHSAYSIAWIACAVALTRALPTLGARFAFVTIGIVVAVVVGLTRLYLRVHWLSDVLSGWGLGATVFALCGIAALVVGFVRENDRASAPAPPAPDRA